MSHPTHLGKYRITEVLGEGAMGVVYKGFDPDIQRVVALKTIRQSLGDHGQMLALRFRNEAQAAGRLSHPGIVSVYDFGQAESVAFIAMEFVEGRTLAFHLANQVRFTDEDIPGLMTQLLDALHHAHEQGVWHRDIKPANIILAPNGRLKIADFGIARIDNAGMTQTQMMVGTPAYMAPEQFLGQAIDRRVDIYSAAVLLYLLLVGRPPFSGASDALMYKVVHEAPVLPSQVEGVSRPRFYDTLLSAGLAKDPARRFATAALFKQALEAAVGAPIDPTGWDRTLIEAPTRRPLPDAAPASRAGQGSTAGSWTQPPSHWDPAQLHAAEVSLARFVGPLASVLVRRAARECHDVGTLYARLAEQVTDPAKRAAFVGHATASGIRPVPAGTIAPPPAPTPTAVGPRTLTPELVEAARRLLAAQIGPMANVVVKKAAARCPQRDEFFAALAETVTDGTARQQFLSALSRLT
jgi:eukaryotic-like serine/threonine-protein kinase